MCFSYLQRLEDGPTVGGQFGVGGLAKELGKGGDGVQLVCRDLRQNLVSSSEPLTPVFPLGLLTSENLPSPNHWSQRMPWLACRLPVARQVTTIPGHQENPLIFPHTSSPIPKPLLSWMKERRLETGEEGHDGACSPSLATCGKHLICSGAALMATVSSQLLLYGNKTQDSPNKAIIGRFFFFPALSSEGFNGICVVENKRVLRNRILPEDAKPVKLCCKSH